MQSTILPLAPSGSKAQFFERLGLDAQEEGDKRTYKAMKSDAIIHYLQITSRRDALLPELQHNHAITAPYTFAQITEIALNQGILRMYEQARSDLKAYYDLGQSTVDGRRAENWVLRWLLWHVFRYRDRRNRSAASTSLATPVTRQAEEVKNVDSDELTTTSSYDRSSVDRAAPVSQPDEEQQQQQQQQHQSMVDALRSATQSVRSSGLPYDPTRDL